MVVYPFNKKRYTFLKHPVEVQYDLLPPVRCYYKFVTSSGYSQPSNGQQPQQIFILNWQLKSFERFYLLPGFIIWRNFQIRLYAMGDLSPSQRFLIEYSLSSKMKSVQYVSGICSNNVTLEWLEMSRCGSVLHHPLDPRITRCLVNTGIPGGV